MNFYKPNVILKIEDKQLKMSQFVQWKRCKPYFRELYICCSHI